MDTKLCTRCEETKPVGDFYRRGGKPVGPCKECKRKYRAANRGRIREYLRSYRSSNRVQILAGQRGYRDRAREEFPERRREANWRAGYVTRCAIYGLEPVIGSGTQAVTQANIVDRFGDRCAVGRSNDCSGRFEELDHVLPVVEGGAHALDNVQPSCSACNKHRWHAGRAWVEPYPNDMKERAA